MARVNDTHSKDEFVDVFNEASPDYAEREYRDPSMLRFVLTKCPEDEVLGIALYSTFRAAYRYRANGHIIIPREEINQSEFVAFHEAGHAVAAHTCNGEIMKVTIAPEPEEQAKIRAEKLRAGDRDDVPNCLGYMLGRPRRASRTQTWNDVRITLGGPVAEGIRFGYSGYYMGGDARQAVNAARSVTSGPKRRHAYLLRAFDQTEVLIEHHWEMVENLAKALMEHKTLQGAEVIHAMYGS